MSDATPDRLFKVLIVDDDDSFRKLLELRLKSIFVNLDVTWHPNLTEARESLSGMEALPYDLVICDQHLPDGKGTDFIGEGWFQDLAVLSVSSDDAPELAGKTMQAGAMFFLAKQDISEPLFKPLVKGLVDRNRLQQRLAESKVNQAVISSVKTLVATLRHEINNPLGAVLGAAFLLKNDKNATKQLQEAANLVESSGQRIKHVLDQLCEAIELEPVTKANQEVYHIPGDKPWEEN